MIATAGCRCREMTVGDCCVAMYFGVFVGLYGALSPMSIKAAMIGFMASSVAAFLVITVLPTAFEYVEASSTVWRLKRKCEAAMFFAMGFFGTIAAVRVL